jgi:hypothetical protein
MHKGLCRQIVLGEEWARAGAGGSWLMDSRRRELPAHSSAMRAASGNSSLAWSLEKVPTPVWYWLGVGSIAASLILKLRGRGQDALFVGQWPPTFFILAVLFKQTRPSQES